MKEPMAHYLLNMITSWAIVCDVWYLPPQTKRVNLSVYQGLVELLAVSFAVSLWNIVWEFQCIFVTLLIKLVKLIKLLVKCLCLVKSLFEWSTSRYILRVLPYLSFQLYVICLFTALFCFQEDETAIEFANRIKSDIARQGGLVDLVW